MRSPRSKNDTSRLGYTNIEEGESSKTTEERSDKGKNTKLTYHFCVNMTNLRTWVTITNAISKDTRHKIAGPKP